MEGGSSGSLDVLVVVAACLCRFSGAFPSLELVEDMVGARSRFLDVFGPRVRGGEATI